MGRTTYPLETLPEPARRAADKDLLRRTHLLAPVLKKGLEEAWERSLLVGETGIRGRENGGILVRTWPGGSLEWRPAKPGMSDSIEIGADLLAGETLVATAHTHPYGELVGSPTGVAFSASDLVGFILGTPTMAYVRSGDTVSMVRRTDALEKLVKEKGWALSDEIEKTYAEAAGRFGGSYVASSHAGTMAVCKKFGFEYFRGEGDTLTKEDVSKFRLPP